MKSKWNIGVLLKGGLGNQLFQIAAGLHSSNGGSIEIFSNITLPRNTAGVVDALYFKWPGEVTENRRKSSKLEKKLLALNLKYGIREKSLPEKLFVSRIVGVITDLMFSLKFRAPTHVVSGEGVGFCEINLKTGHNLLNGYFQAHQYPFDPAVYNRLREIRLVNESSTLIRWIEKARLENPIFIHLRLGDYKNESGIGVIPTKYYEKALRELELKGVSRNIWIFTDEAESVHGYIQPPSEFKITVIGENGLNPAETLELMRHGSAYVIANSTFSWWGAFLSYRSGCPKIMPTPWFQNMPSPVGIKPPDWIEIDLLKD